MLYFIGKLYKKEQTESIISVKSNIHQSNISNLCIKLEETYIKQRSGILDKDIHMS